MDGKRVFYLRETAILSVEPSQNTQKIADSWWFGIA
jgi:hypothetical protein